MEGQTSSTPGRGGGPARRPFFRRRKSCPFSGPNAPKIDYKDVRLLQRYVSERGKIVPSRITAVSALKPRELAQAIARALHRHHAVCGELKLNLNFSLRLAAGSVEAAGWSGRP